MWHKRHRSQDPNAPAGKRLRDNIADLYSSGEIAGDRAQSLFDDAGEFANELGSAEMQDMRSSGTSKNQNRDLRRRLLRRSNWPPMYVQEVRSWSVKQKEVVRQKLAILLPHEIIAALAQVGDPEVLCQEQGLDTWNLKKHQEISEKLQQPFVSLSLWGDGVPFSWDRKRSADIWTLSLPGLEDKAHRDIRIPLTSMPHEMVLKETQDDVFEILSWSFKALALGRFPDSRADGQPWTSEDVWRKKQSGVGLMLGALLEVKGDWKQLRHCFAIPSWMRSEEKPICWRCLASKASLKEESGPHSSWLRPENRVEHFQGLARIMDEGETLSPAFSIPWFSLSSLRLDWLHVADQGITPVFMGGLLHLIMTDANYGPNEEARVAWIWERMQQHYEQEGTKDRLFNLTKTMVKPKKGSIELAGSGAQIRCLVPFCLQLVNSWELPLSEEQTLARTAMRHLHRCYSFLSAEAHLENRPDSLLDNALALHTTLRSLHGIHAARWQLRPKLHLFMELCAEGGPPSSSWNYREESFGGSVGRQSHHRGGLGTLLSMSRAMLTKFCSKEGLPRLMPS